MPRNGSGVYSKPAGTAAVANTDIESSKYNLTIDDLVTDANAARPIAAGGTGATTAHGALDNLTKKATNVASASTTNIGAANGRYVAVTGTATITAFDAVDAGIERVLRFSDALTLTHNGTSLILPGGTNITTAAGDTAIFVSEGSGNWRCHGYLFSSSQQVLVTATQSLSNKSFEDSTTQLYDNSDATKKLQFQLSPITTATTRTVTAADRNIDLKNVPQVIASGTVSNQSSLDITGIPSDARRIIIQLSNIISASDGVNLFARIDSGAGFISTAGAYAWSHLFFSTSVAVTKDGSASASAMVVTPGFGTGANETGHCEFTVQQAAAGNIPGFFWRTELLDAVAAHRVVMGGARRLASGSVEGVRFEMSTGNISCDYVVIAIRD